MPESVRSSSLENDSCDENSGKKSKSILLAAGYNPELVWNQKVPNTELERFQKYIEDKYDKRFASYWEFHKWTVENYIKFWEEIWIYFGVRTSKPYDKVFVKTGPGFLDIDWFTGARFNFAENILRIRDSRIALMYIDELGNEDVVTYAEMFEEVKLYAAAFRKNGLKKGDVVACYISHRKEAIFAMLAATSIGAIWGGAVPFFGARPVTNIVKMIEAKFLITVDFHQEGNTAEKMLDRIAFIAENCPTIEIVILVVTLEETYEKGLSNIRNCVFLENFLQDGRTPEGNVPDIAFEQLPFSHPLSINFTSGTTGIPKAAIHSAGTLISNMRDHVLHMNLKSGDTISTLYAAGWSLWDCFLPTLSLGVKFLLYSCSPLQKINGKNFWEKMAEYKATLTFLVPAAVDKMEKMGIEPSPESNLDCLKVVLIGGSPIKKKNFEYLRNKVKKDMFIGSLYGATEVFGAFSGFNLNMPAYAAEIQAFSLGMDVQCFDSKGKSVIGQRGELVICTPGPGFPIALWKDDGNQLLTETYFSKYPEVWALHDEGWINPKTNGLIVIGRSDDTLKQWGERFAPSDIYITIHAVEELQDYICVGQQRSNGDGRAVLFLKMRKGYKLTPAIRTKIEQAIQEDLDEDFIPEVIIEVPDIPYNLNNKRLESVVKKIVQTNKIPDFMNIKNPESLEYFVNIPEIVNYDIL